MQKIKSKFILNALNKVTLGNYYDFYFRGNKYRIVYNEHFDEENGKLNIDTKNGTIYYLLKDEINVGAIHFMEYGKIVNGIPYKI
jgi:hypothetical protein